MLSLLITLGAMRWHLTEGYRPDLQDVVPQNKEQCIMTLARRSDSS